MDGTPIQGFTGGGKRFDQDMWQSHLGKKGKQQSNNRFLIDKKLEAMLVTSMC